METAEWSDGEWASVPGVSRTRTRLRSIARTGRLFAGVLAVCDMLATSGCAYTYDTAYYKKGGDIAKDIGTDYTLTVLLLPMLIVGILAVSSR